MDADDRVTACSLEMPALRTRRELIFSRLLSNRSRAGKSTTLGTWHESIARREHRCQVPTPALSSATMVDVPIISIRPRPPYHTLSLHSNPTHLVGHHMRRRMAWRKKTPCSDSDYILPAFGSYDQISQIGRYPRFTRNHTPLCMLGALCPPVSSSTVGG